MFPESAGTLALPSLHDVEPFALAFSATSGYFSSSMVSFSSIFLISSAPLFSVFSSSAVNLSFADSMVSSRNSP